MSPAANRRAGTQHQSQRPAIAPIAESLHLPEHLYPSPQSLVNSEQSSGATFQTSNGDFPIHSAFSAQPQPDPSQIAWNLTQVAAKAKASNNRLTNNHKDLTLSLSTYSKAVEKKLKTDLDSVWDLGALDGKDAVLITAIRL
ncbi:hypothetical protein HDV00_000293 [Rhizophlyctis rosea]|nr:hypothetical protein HDV00_000293 [Rhizophlyctis rosea]